MVGWIRLHRRIQQHWIWKRSRKLSWAEAWIDLLLDVNHTDAKLPVGFTLIEVSRGQVLTSQVKLAERWGWNRKTVKKFLDLLEKDEMLRIDTDTGRDTGMGTGYTLISIVNYEKYQSKPDEGMDTDADTSADTDADSEGTGSGQGRGHKQEEPNNNSDKNRKKKEPAASRRHFGPPLPADAYPDWLPPEVWEQFRAHRNRGKVKLTLHAERLLIKKLSELRDNGDDPTAVIEQSIMNDWKGLFSINKNGRQGSSKQHAARQLAKNQAQTELPD